MTARTTPRGAPDPCPGAAACVRVLLANQGAAPAVLALSLVPDRGTRATLARDRVTVPPGARREAEIDVAGAGADGLAAGRLVVSAEGGAPVLVHPFAVAVEPPGPPPLGPLALERDGDRVRGVRFALGAFERGDPLGGGTSVALDRAARADARRRARRAAWSAASRRPAARASCCPRSTRTRCPPARCAALPAGRYAFRAVARGPRGGAPAEARSEPFAP